MTSNSPQSSKQVNYDFLRSILPLSDRANALLTDLEKIEFSPSGKREPLIEVIAPSSNNPRPGLRALLEYLRSNSMAGTTSSEELASLGEHDRLTARVRAETQVSLMKLIRSYWDFVKAEIADGNFIFPKDSLNGPPLRISFSDWDKIEVLRVPWPEVHNTFNPFRRDMRIAVFELAIARTTEYLAYQWSKEVSQTEDYQEAAEFLALRLLRPERAIWNGIVSGMNFAGRTASVLFNAMEPKEDPDYKFDFSIDPRTPVGMEHKTFVTEIAAGTNLKSFIELLNTPAQFFDGDLGFYLRQHNFNFTRMERSSFETLTYKLLEYDPRFFVVRDHLAFKDFQVPLVDLNLEAFGSKSLSAMTNNMPILGCPSGPVLSEFLDWVLLSYDRIVCCHGQK